jgi:hypothetical protein
MVGELDKGDDGLTLMTTSGSTTVPGRVSFSANVELSQQPNRSNSREGGFQEIKSDSLDIVFRGQFTVKSKKGLLDILRN